MAELLIQNGSTIYYPAVEEGIKLSLERKGVPGKLDFTVVEDDTLNFQEGNRQCFTVLSLPKSGLLAMPPLM